MKRALALLLMIIMLVSIAIMSIADDEYQVYAFCNPKDRVNARMNPSKKSQIVGTYECGEIIYTDGVIKKDNRGGKWLHIWCGFEVGEAWISKKYVSESEITVGACIATVVKHKTALRRAPGGKRIKQLKVGTELQVLCFTDDWILTKQGYIKADCVEINW